MDNIKIHVYDETKKEYVIDNTENDALKSVLWFLWKKHQLLGYCYSRDRDGIEIDFEIPYDFTGDAPVEGETIACKKRDGGVITFIYEYEKEEQYVS